MNDNSDQPPTNRLGNETSPYLRQHQHNPVDWYPWGEEALAAARASGKPILLSIGYSTCHWCHVMARESFADPATAALMNEHFVSIKVDREERPDIDKIYQLAHNILTQSSGGWPLTMFLDPETHIPFFGGTYFPKQTSAALPGFTDLLRRVAELFATKRDELQTAGDKVSEVFAKLSEGPGAEADAVPAWEAIADQACEMFKERYDKDAGGFGRAPKFPNAPALDFLLARWAAQGKSDRTAYDMVMITLTQMARGGIYDQLGGGFCRYSTDREWRIPHFEKMLCDNGALLTLYADALAIAPDALFTDVVADTIGWLERDMRAPEGAFYAAQDADSDGEEGAYYLWRRGEVRKLLTEDENLLIETLYGLDKPANFSSRWVLARRDSWRGVIDRIYLDADDPRAVFESARGKLLTERLKRRAPGRDEKILAGWNGLAINGIARAGLVAQRSDWIELAAQGLEFLRTEMLVDGRLYATWQAGTPRLAGYLDDHAFCLQAALTLLEADWHDATLYFARQVADAALEHFAAPGGGFFFTADDHEALIHRTRPSVDEASANGNAVMGAALFDLGHLLADTRYIEAAQGVLAWARPFSASFPTGHASMLRLAARADDPGVQVILRGPPDPAWLAACRTGYHADRRVYAIPYDGVHAVPDYLPRMVSAEVRARTTAYLCEGFQCSAPITELEALQEALN
ncbi:MAG: thioredoxin domain-containing protein [Pseudomonadota bacterium]